MLYKFFLCFLLLKQSTVQTKEIQSLTVNAQQQANIMGQAFIKGDYQIFAKYTYPALLIAMGGESRMAATLTQTVNDMRAKGMSFSSIVIDNPSKIVKSGSELQCTLQQHTTIKLANGRAVATSTLIAISKDGGKNWLFVDTNNKSTVMMRKAPTSLSVPDLLASVCNRGLTDKSPGLVPGLLLFTAEASPTITGDIYA